MSVSITVEDAVDGIVVSSAVLVPALARLGLTARHDPALRATLAGERRHGVPAVRIRIGRGAGVPVWRLEPALAGWRAAAVARTVWLAGSRSYCAGVERAN